MAISIAVAMVQSQLDYFNSMLSGISAFNINKLQRVPNLATKIALNDWHWPSQELISQLYLFPIHSRIKFKISSLTFKLLAENQPANHLTLITLYVPLRLLRSSDKSLLVQPPTRTSMLPRGTVPKCMRFGCFRHVLNLNGVSTSNDCLVRSGNNWLNCSTVCVSWF